MPNARFLPLLLGIYILRNGLAGERVGQQPLQGFHLAPAAFLRCLDDAYLQPPDFLMTLGPANAVPVTRVAEERTSACCLRRHLLFLLRRLFKLSRQEKRGGSLPAFAWRDVAVHSSSHLLSIPLQGGIRLLHHPLPASSTVFLAVHLPRGQRYGLTVFHTCYISRLGSAYSPVTLCPCVRRSNRTACHVPFWFQPVSIFGWSFLTRFISGSSRLALPPSLVPVPRRCWQHWEASRGTSFSHEGLHCPGGFEPSRYQLGPHR